KNLSKHIKESDNRYKTRKFVNLISYFLSMILIIIVFLDDIRGITLTLGVASAGIAFALKEVIASVAGFINITTGNIYKAGDRIEIGGIKGDVIDLSILRTTIMEVGEWVNGDLYNGRIVRIANNFVFKGPVYNYSGNFPFIWDEIKIPLKFGSDYIYTKKILENTVEEIVGVFTKDAEVQWKTMVRRYLIEDAKTGPMVTMEINDNWVEYTIRYVVDYRKRRYTKDLLFTKILEEASNSREKIQFASATYELVGVPKMDVNIKKTD
ncbi:MAG: mechanosensitive ion channel domain-containing protein, partial [Senegalia sp. (in: firmicutes)]